MLPQGMFSVAVATVLFPALSRLVARQDWDGLRATQGNGMRQIALLLIPSAAVTIALAEPITRLVYQRGEFDAESTEQVSEALFWFSFSLPFSGFNLLLTRTFFSLQEPWTPTALAGMTLAINAAVSAALYEPLGIAGIVLGTVVSTAAMTVGQAYFLRRRIGGLQLGTTLKAAAKMVVAAAVLGGVAYGTWYAARRHAGRIARRPGRLGRRRDRARQRRVRGDRARPADPGGAPDRPAVHAPPAQTLKPPKLYRGRHGRPGTHPELLHHRPHRPREVDAGRPHPRAHAHGRPAGDARPAARLDGPRARARDHDQGPGGARLLHGARRRDLPAAPDRHARPRRLHLRGLAQPRGVRGRAAGGRRVAGRRGADGRQHLPGDRLRAGADPFDEQGRPAGRRAGPGGRGDRRADRRAARRHSRASPPRPARASRTCSRSWSSACRRRTATWTRRRAR